MAYFQKNKGNQLLFILTKSGDGSFAKGATVSQITANSPKFFGVNNGSAAAATSGAISRAASLVTSGVFRQSLKATECNFDMVLYKFNATSCMEQVIPVMFQTYTSENISDMVSQVQAYLVSMSAMLSDVASDVLDVRSQVSDVYSLLTVAKAGTYSGISDIEAYLVNMSAMLSDVASQALRTYSAAVLTQSLASDAQSQAARTYSRVMLDASVTSDIQSYLVAMSGMLSDVASQAERTYSRVLLNASTTSDVQSYLVALSAQLSDTYSAVKAVVGGSAGLDPMTSQIYSLLQSRIPGVFGTSSDMLSKMHGSFDAQLSQIYSAAQGGGVDVSSAVSDIYSLLSSRVPAVVTTASDLASQVEGVLSSQLDEILSAARAGGTGTDPSLTEQVSDIYSLLTTTKSRVLKGDSVTLAYLNGMSGMLSDVASDVLNVRSQVSDIYSLLTDTKAGLSADISNIQSQVVGLSAVSSDIYSLLGAGVTIDPAAIADEILDRNLAGGGSGDTRNVRNALRTLRNKVLADGTASVIRIYDETDTSVAWSAAISTAAGNPIVKVDP